MGPGALAFQVLCGLQQLWGYEGGFEKSVDVDSVVFPRFPEASERAQEGRGIRNFDPGSVCWGSVTAWLGVLRRFFFPGFGPADH